MHSSCPTLLALAGLFGAVAAFSCPSYISDYGFKPVCCLNINGQVGTGCIPAHQMGVENPTWECNAAVYNNEGCCQSIDYTNPSTGQSIYLCSSSIGT